MIKNWKMALRHVRNNLSFKVMIMLELAAILAFSAAFISGSLKYIKRENLYQITTDYAEANLQGITAILGILLLIFGFSMLASYNSKLKLQKEEFYGIYYLCGASWKDCVQIQLLEDIITIGIPLCVTTILLRIYDIWRDPVGVSESMLSLEGFCIMTAICLLTFLLTSLKELLRLHKKSPVTIIRRWE